MANIKCRDCTECYSCAECKGCDNCIDCKYCIDCDNCINSSFCYSCGGLVAKKYYIDNKDYGNFEAYKRELNRLGILI